MLRSDPDEKSKLDEQDSIILNSTLTSPTIIIELPTKSYVESVLESRNKRRDLSSVFNDQDNEFDNNIIPNLDSVVVNRIPSSDKELSNKKYVDDSIGEGNVLRFNQTFEDFLEVSVGNDTNNLAKTDRIQMTDTASIRYPNTDGYLLQNWVIKCNDENYNGKIQKIIKSTKTNSPTGHYLLSVIALCIYRHHLIIMVMTYLSASNELILFKLVI